MLLPFFYRRESDMAVSRKDADYELRQTACVSLGKCIRERSRSRGLSNTDLEPLLGFLEASGSNFGLFARGRRVPSHERIMQVALAAFRKGLLTHEEIQEMGFLKSDFDERKHKKKTFLQRRQLAIIKFERGMENMRAGLLPYAMRDRDGRKNRPPKSTAEFITERRKWITDIESLGGEVRYLPYMRRPTKKDRSLRVYEAGVAGIDMPNWALYLDWREGDFADSLARDEYEAMYEGFDFEDYDSVEEYEAAVHEAAIERERAMFDPAVNDKKLYLWFGGRDYSHPYRLAEDDEITASIELGIPREDFYGGYGGTDDDAEWPSRSDDLDPFFSAVAARRSAKKRSLFSLASSAAPDQLVYWLDLSMYGVQLKIVRLSDGRINLVLAGLKIGASHTQAVESSQGLESLGFLLSASGRTLVRVGADLLLGELLDTFPKGEVIEVPAPQTWARIKASASELVEMDRAVH